MFRLGTSLRWITAALVVGAAMFWQPQEISPSAHAEDSGPLAPAAELLRRKGFKNNLNQLCDVFHLRPGCAAYNVATDDDEKELLAKFKLPTDWVVTFEIVADPPTGQVPVILAIETTPLHRITNALAPHSIAYAFLTDFDGRLHAVAIGRPSKSGKKWFWDFKPAETTSKLRDMFAREVSLWSSKDFLKEFQQAPDRKD